MTDQDGPVKYQGLELKKVKEFKYLGRVFQTNGGSLEHLNKQQESSKRKIMMLNSFFFRGKGLNPGYCRNIVNSAANSQILYGLKTCIKDLYCEEIANKYDIAERKMMRAAIRCE